MKLSKNETILNLVLGIFIASLATPAFAGEETRMHCAGGWVMGDDRVRESFLSPRAEAYPQGSDFYATMDFEKIVHIAKGELVARGETFELMDPGSKAPIEIARDVINGPLKFTFWETGPHTQGYISVKGFISINERLGEVKITRLMTRSDCLRTVIAKIVCYKVD